MLGRLSKRNRHGLKRVKVGNDKTVESCSCQ
jgi:hypothetical protein